MSFEKLALSSNGIWKRIDNLRISSIDGLAPKFYQSLMNGTSDMRGKVIKLGAIFVELDWMIFETLRSDELQQIYFQQGTTNAPTAEHSWHYYGLAVDGISSRFKWFDSSAAQVVWPRKTDREAYAEAWFLECGQYFEKYNCKLGAKWEHPDLPHVQWGNCSASPHQAPQLKLEGGNRKVWEAVHAV
jgi:hypothetical protein